MPDTLLSVRGLRKCHQTPQGALSVLDGIEFDLGSGESMAVMGESGSGKSTLLHLIAGLDAPDGGTLRLDGIEITGLPDHRRAALRRGSIGLVFQQFNLVPSLTVSANLALQARLAARDDPVLRQRLAERLGLETMLDRYPEALSGGQRQRVALARALVDEPDLLILDDALSAVDTDTERWILEALETRHGEHTTILISHRLSTLKHADRILVLDGGRIVQQGTHETLSAESGLYRRLWRLQSSLEEEALADRGGALADAEQDQKTHRAHAAKEPRPQPAGRLAEASLHLRDEPDPDRQQTDPDLQ